jgi:lysophospholipase L1-like esterase
VAALAVACAAPPPRVVVIGDSMTALAQPDLSAVLGPHYDIGYVFRIGVRIDQLHQLVVDDLHGHGTTQAAVVNLGTNDVLDGRSARTAVADLDRLLRTLRPAQCVVLTTIGPGVDHRARSDVGVALNERMAGLAATDPRRFKLVDWAGFLSRSDSATRARYLQVDGVHETPLGARWLADADLAALASCDRPATT